MDVSAHRPAVSRSARPIQALGFYRLASNALASLAGFGFSRLPSARRLIRAIAPAGSSSLGQTVWQLNTE